MHDALAAAAGPPPANEGDLAQVLSAWHQATVRLEQTHAALQAEVARLTAELECKNRELARRNRLADLGQMASHVAHEVRNSLVPVTLYLSLLRRRLSADAGSLEVLNKVEAGCLAVDATVNDLLHFAAGREPRPSWVPLAPLVEEVATSLAPQLEAQHVTLELQLPPQAGLWVDRDLLRRALLNLLLNALDAQPAGGQVVVSAYESADWLELEVADQGPGLPEATCARLFEPFFSTKNTGTGLGLAIVDRVAEAHGGRVWATNCPEGGAAFTLRLPRRASRSMERAA